jgi:hypothetical protein
LVAELMEPARAAGYSGLLDVVRWLQAPPSGWTLHADAYAQWAEIVRGSEA